MWDILTQVFEYFSKDPFVQLTGFSAMIVIIFAYLQKDDYNVKKLMLLSTLLWGTHFYLLGMYSGLAANAIWVVRFFLSVKFWRNKNAFIFVVLLTIWVAYFTVNGIWSFIPVIASIVWAFSYFFLENLKLRFAMLFNSFLWVAYHSYVGSLTWMMNDILTQSLLIFTIYRMAHPEWGTRYYAQKIKEILWKRSRPDYDRFIFVYDKVSQYRKTLWYYFHETLNYDLKSFFQKKKWLISSLSFLKEKEIAVLESTLWNLQLKK